MFYEVFLTDLCLYMHFYNVMNVQIRIKTDPKYLRRDISYSVLNTHTKLGWYQDHAKTRTGTGLVVF